jgi:SsrA-binding protein
MAAKKKSSLISHGIAAQNRKARFDYAIKETVEAGLVLRGPEVKSLRLGRATISEAWAGEREGEIFLFNAYIPEYQGGVLSRFEPRGMRKLLLHKKEMTKLLAQVARAGLTLVPLDIHFNARGVAKVTLGLGQGRNKADKRHAIADRDWQRDKARLMRDRGERERPGALPLHPAGAVGPKPHSSVPRLASTSRPSRQHLPGMACRKSCVRTITH